ncbi:MAG: purine-nucleoside phosphorylase [Bacteroidaceae bacterium]|nr:purine-nucleoside phosphorylase [Bacteroidaceae bacterium]
MATPHISAPDGAFAKTLLMPGDPLRAKFIAETFLTEAQLVTSVRNVLGYTGLYKDVPVSVMASGMGMPSIGIYSYELYKFYGVENIIRIGSAGSYRDWLNVMDVTLAERAVSESTFAQVQGGCQDHAILPNAELNAAIRKTAKELDIELKMSVVHSSDVFYADPSQGTWQDIAERTGSDCVEMESFALFHNANMLGKRAACLLTISDSFVNHVELTSEQRQNSFTEMMKLALETAIDL